MDSILWITGADEPYFEEIASPVTVTVVAGQPAILSCNVRNLGDIYKVGVYILYYNDSEQYEILRFMRRYNLVLTIWR